MRSFAVASFFFSSSSSFSLEIQEESPAFGLPSAPARRREVGGDGLPITQKAGCLLHFFGGAARCCVQDSSLSDPVAYRRKQGAAVGADDRRSSYPQARTPAPLSLSPALRAPLPYHFLMIADSELMLPESN